MKKATVILKKGEGRYLKAGGAWIYDNEIDKIQWKGEPDNGSLVDVLDFDGYYMGVGFINTNSKITVRMMSRKNEEIDGAFLYNRVKAAWEYRKTVMMPQDLNCCRVIFGEADFLPGLVIDKYDDVLVVESLAMGIDRLKLQIIEALKQILAEDG